MADIKLFKIQSESAHELPPESVDIEKSLQSLMELHLKSFLGVRFLATEFFTGKEHSGRIDTLGLDDNNCPVIIEYKRALNVNIICQGLFYLGWLADHRGDFTMAVQQKLGSDAAAKIDWSGPRVLCIAGDFTRYDEYMIRVSTRYAASTVKGTAETLVEYLDHEGMRRELGPWRQRTGKSIPRRLAGALAAPFWNYDDDDASSASRGKRFAFSRIAASFASGFAGMAWTPDSINTPDEALKRSATAFGGYFASSLFTEFKPDLAKLFKKVI